jgi:glycosyltransferase involved in cell wall biosynthesis
VTPFGTSGRTSNPRIAIVSHSHPSISKGGAEIAAYTLFRGLRQLGREAIFVGAAPNKARAQVELGPNEHALFYDGDIYDHFYQIGAPGVGAELVEILRREQIGLTSFHHFFHMGLSAVREVAAVMPTTMTLHEFLAICHHHGQMITRPAQLLCDRASPRACNTCYPEFTRQQFALRRLNFLDTFADISAFVSPSHFLADRFAEWGLPGERIAVIENGLADTRPAVERQRGENPLWNFGFFGQINPFKGLDVLLEACELIDRDPDLAATVRIRIHGNFVGQGADFIERFQATVKQYPFVTYSGPYDNASVSRLMGACDYIVVPSRWWENSPVVIQEAYAAGRPVICTGIGGMAEKVVDGVTGLHFELGDAVDLVGAIRHAAQVEVFDALRAGVRPPTDLAGMARQYLQLFDRLT